MPKRSRIHLTRMSLTELGQLREEVDTAISDRVAAERRELQSKLTALDAFNGSISAGRPSAKRVSSQRTRKAKKVHPLKGKKAAVKYRGPNGETWSGRGLAPRWLAALEKKGKKRDSFLVDR